MKFGAKESVKFQEITDKLTELEIEIKKSEVNQNKVDSLKNYIVNKRKDAFYDSPIVRNYLTTEKLVEEIEKTRPNGEPSQGRYDY